VKSCEDWNGIAKSARTGGGRSQDNNFGDGKGVVCHTVSGEEQLEDELGVLLLERNGWNSRAYLITEGWATSTRNTEESCPSHLNERIGLLSTAIGANLLLLRDISTR
jgi:hypothetical protein